MSHPKNMNELIAICNHNKRLIEAFISQLPANVQDAPSTEQDWAVRDHLAHLGTWVNWMIKVLQREKAWESLDVPQELLEPAERAFDPINAVIYQRHKHLSFEETYELWNQAHANFMTHLRATTYEELGKLYAEYQPHEAHRSAAQYPLYAYIRGGVYAHYTEHLPWIRESAMRAGFSTTNINHLAIVVPSLEEALPFWRDALQLPVGDIKDVPSESVRILFVSTGESHVELVQPTTTDSGIAKYLSEKGAGMHHVCLEVENIEVALADLKAKGIRLINETPKERDGRHYAFVHPKSTGGVLLELYQRLT
jgi:methylmalonyl-CoA/ethylmalonyl-CoA epimerase